MTTRSNSTRAVFAVAAALAITSFQVANSRADDAKADKSQYWLFNPTPDGALRDFAADRPAKSYGPTTIDAGRVQIELEAANFTYLKLDGVRTQTFVGPNPTARIGLTSNVELQLNWAPYVNVRTKFADGTTDNASSGSDFFARTKINIWGNEGGRTALAIMPYVKAGTASESIGGNRATEAGVIVPFTVDLQNNVSLTLNTEWDHLKNSADSSYHSQYVNTIGISAPLVKDVTITGEVWSQINVDPAGTSRQYSFDTAVAWMARPNLQLDVGANFGLNKETPAFQVYTGITRRF